MPHAPATPSSAPSTAEPSAGSHCGLSRSGSAGPLLKRAVCNGILLLAAGVMIFVVHQWQWRQELRAKEILGRNFSWNQSEQGSTAPPCD